MKIAILKQDFGNRFEGEQYIVDLSRQFEGYEKGDLICQVHPFGPVYLPLQLEIAIRQDGSIAFRSWKFTNTEPNSYLHTFEKSKEQLEHENNSYAIPFVPTEAQIDTVNGLFSGRIKFEGLKIAVGATVQKICLINVAKEEQLIGQKIYLA
jgi:hypothetical protein